MFRAMPHGTIERERFGDPATDPPDVRAHTDGGPCRREHRRTQVSCKHQRAHHTSQVIVHLLKGQHRVSLLRIHHGAGFAETANSVRRVKLVDRICTIDYDKLAPRMLTSA